MKTNGKNIVDYTLYKYNCQRCKENYALPEFLVTETTKHLEFEGHQIIETFKTGFFTLHGEKISKTPKNWRNFVHAQKEEQ
jgi:GTP:adenosylcobinamide-phosphate guanylyltransferase